MNDLLTLSDSRKINQFKIDYPYYGLFGTADVTPIDSNSETLYSCKLLNGTILLVKKLLQQRKWVDASLNMETPLSSVIGMYIDDFLRVKGFTSN
jgi:hypothetical protein